MNKPVLFAFIALGFCLLAVNSYARIKLITLPVREKVEIQLENKDTTIIEEERIVPVKKGNNTIDFAWHNTSIDPDTIVLRLLPEKNHIANIISVSYPPNESALIWSIYSSENGSVRVRITYAIHELNKKYHYQAKVNADETKMTIAQYIKVRNQSGEEFLNASMNTGREQSINLPMGMNETQEFLTNEFVDIPIEKTYQVNAAELGYRNRAQDKLNVLMHYQIYNDAQHNLGKEAMPAGKFRIFQRDSQGTLVFIGEDWGEYTPKDDEQKLFVGQARDIVVKRLIDRKKRQRINGNLYNIDALVKYEIENFKDKPVTLIIEESIPHLLNEVFSSRHSGRAIEWQVGKETTFKDKPLKKYTSGNTIAYQLILPARSGSEKVVKLEQKLNINFKNEW
jgi:hypothetical protein